MDSLLDLRGQSASSSSINLKDESASGKQFFRILWYCSLILFVPILSFFATKHFILEGILSFDAKATSTNVTSALVAVVILHLALGLFIYKANFEEANKSKIGKQE